MELPVNFIALSGILIGASSLFMAVLMFSLGRDSVSRIWGAFCIAVCVWGTSFFFIATSPDPDVARLWWKISHIGVILIPVLFLHFALRFLKIGKRTLLLGSYAISAFFLFSNLATSWLIDEMRFVFGLFYYDSPPGPMYLPFVILFHAAIVYGHYLLLRAYLKSADETEREKIRYFFMATFVGFLGGGVSFSPVFGFDIYPVTIITVTLYPVIMGFAILRYQLFDLKVAVAQILALVIFTFAFIQIFLAENPLQFWFRIALTGLSLVLGIYLVRSVRHEIEQRELIEAQEQELQVANRQQESLLHFISHEVKGYLTKSEAAFDAIRSGDYGHVTPELHEMSGMALADVRKGVDTVIDILDASNLKRGTVSYTKDTFDLVKTVDEIVHDLQGAAHERGLDLVFERPVTGAYVIVGDEEKLRRHVIRNIIDNSVKYTLKGHVRVELARTDRLVRMTVTDTGVGITEGDMKRLFTEGGKGTESLKVNVHSTGYGLFIARTIVEGHAGRIWAESEGKDKGSRFIVELPVARA